MKLHIPLRLRYALLTLFCMSVLPAQADVVLNDYSPQNWPIVENDNLILNADWGGESSGVMWAATQPGTYSLTGSGTISTMFSISGVGKEETNFQIGSGVQMKGATVDVSNASATYAGTILGGTTEKSRFGAYGGAVFDLSGATFADGALVSLRIGSDGGAVGGTVRLDYTVNANQNLSIGCQSSNYNVLDGDLTLADSGVITFYGWAGDLNSRYLDVTGTVNIAGASILKFNTLNGNNQIPSDGAILITCSELTGNALSQLKLQAQPEGGHSDVYSELTGYSVKSMATADGYALYLASTTSTDIPTVNLNAHDWANDSFPQYADSHLSISGTVEAPTSYVSWCSDTSEPLSLNGTGILEVKELGVENDVKNDEVKRNFVIEEGVTLKNTSLHVWQGAQVTYEGTIASSDGGQAGFTVYEGAFIDLNNATIADGTHIELSFERGGRIALENYKVTTGQKLSFHSVSGYGDNVFDGNLELADGGLITMSSPGSGEWLPLQVTGNIDVSGAAHLNFKKYTEGYDAPTTGSVLFTCASVSGDAGLLTLSQSYLGNDGLTYSREMEGYLVKSMAYGDGYALYLAAAESIVSELVLNDYPAGASIVATDTNLKLTGDWSATWDESSGAYPVHNLIDWVAETTGTYSLSGSGTMGGVDIAASAAEGRAASFEIGSGVTLHDSSLTAEGGATLSFAGTLTRGMGHESWFAAFEGGTIDIREASIADDARLSLMMERGGTIRCGTYTADSLRRIEVVSPLSSEVETSSTLDGNLVLTDGGRIEYSAFKDGGNIVSAGALNVTGSVTIAGAATLSFVLDNANEYYAPADNSVLITCSSLSGDLSLLKLETGIWDDDMMEPSYKELEDKVVKSMSYGDGYALYIAAIGADNPPPTPPVDPEPPVEPEVEIITNGTVTTPLSDTQLVQLSSGGTVDVSSLDSLPQQYISGTGGTLETAADQTLALSGIQQVGYSIAAAAGEQSGAGLVVGRTGGKITDATIEFNGSHYDTASLQVRSGLAEIGTGTTLGNGTGASTIEVGTGTGSGVTASVNNFGTLEADVTINAHGSMDNRKSIVGDVALNNGGVLINSGGSITGDVSVADDALFRNDGVMDGVLVIETGAKAQGCGTYDEVLVMDGGRLHVGNSPGRSSVNTLHLTSGSILSFTVDGTKPGNGSGYHSQMKVTDALTFNGVARAEVEVTRGILSCGLNTFTLPLLDASGATITDKSGSASPISATIIEGAELLEDGYTFKWNAASGSLTLTGKVDAKAAATVLDEDGSIIANTLWSSTSMVRSFARTATSQLGAPVGDKTDGVSMWVAGLGDFISMDGFTSNAGGGALGAEAIITSNWRMGVALGVMSGTFTPDRGMDEVEQDGSMVGLYSEYVENLGADAGFRFSVYAAYGEVENEAKTYVAGSHELPGEATWSDDVFSVGTRLTWQFRVGEQTTLAPFIGLEYLSGTQESFTEKFAGGKREYRDGSMYTVSLPVGITARTCVDLGEGQKLLPELTLAYVGDISRKTPEVRSRVFGIENNHKGTEPGRSAFMLNAGTHWMMSESWSMGAFYNLEARSKEVSQEATMFIRCNF